MGRLIALTVALLAGALIAWSQVRSPAPAGPDAPAATFSAARAMAVVRDIAQVPHPIGSAANHQARDRLLARMAALGLSPRLRQGDVVAPARAGVLWGASPQSLIGVLPGRDRGQPMVALMAHYDSRPGAPGAADDAAGVAAALEAVRAIAAHGVPARDVAVILTDGEEAGCLCGAREVLAHDPIARRLGLVVNLEARGSAGRALMFETGPRDGQALALFRDAAVAPMTGSIFQEVYARLPNDTDFTLVRRAGIAGFNFAFTGAQRDYHQPTDAPASLSRGALQDLGQQALSVAGTAAFAPRLPAAAPDVSYGVVFGRAMILYPPAIGWGVLALAAALLALAMARAHRREALRPAEVVRGAGAGLYALAAGASFLHLAQAMAAPADPLGARRLLAQAGRVEIALILAAAGALLFASAEAARGRRAPGALVPLLAGLASCALAGGLDRIGLGEGLAAAVLALAIGRGPIGRPGAWAGVLVLGLAVGIAAQVVAPLAAYVVAWPLAAAALAAAASDLAFDRRADRLALLAVAAALVAGWAGALAHLIVVVTGFPELLLLPLLVAAFALWPLAQPEAGAPPARLPGRGLLLAAAAIALFVRLESPWDARRPRPSLVAYQLDQDAGRAWRIAPAELRTAWSDAVLRAEGAPIQRLDHWAWRTPVDAAPARLSPIPAPALRLEKQAGGIVLATLVPPPGVRALSLQISPDVPVRLQAVGAAATALSPPPGRWTRIYWSAPPAEGLTLRIATFGPGALAVRYALSMDGWAPGVAPPRPPPAGVMAVESSGEALVTGSRRLAW